MLMFFKSNLCLNIKHVWLACLASVKLSQRLQLWLKIILTFHCFYNNKYFSKHLYNKALIIVDECLVMFADGGWSWFQENNALHLPDILMQIIETKSN